MGIVLNSEKIAATTNFGQIENIILNAKDNFIASQVDSQNYIVAQSKKDIDYGGIILIVKGIKRKIREVIGQIV